MANKYHYAFYCLLIVLLQLSGCASVSKTPFSMQSNNPAVATALQLQGHPYVIGGESPAEGFDCSGLVYYVYQQHGVSLPRDAWSQAHELPMVDAEQRQPGDLVFFNTGYHAFSHVGIYLGANKFVHAPSDNGKVMVSDLNHPYWKRRFSAVRRPRHPSRHLN